jgi:hypothetical protein
MAQRKVVRCFGHGVIHAGPHYQTHWQDVWLRWKGKPGQKVYRAAPCIVTRADLEADLVTDEVWAANYPEGHSFKENCKKQVEYTKRMLAILDTQPFARDDYDCPNVYTNAEFIDRAEAERMLAWYLLDAHGVKNPKFDWEKADFIIGAASWAGITKEEVEAAMARQKPEVNCGPTSA